MVLSGVMILVFVGCLRKNTTNATNATFSDIQVLNPAEYVKTSFRLSDFADTVAFIELAPDYPFVGTVEQITPDRMLVYDRFKSFKFFDRQGRILGEIGKVGQGPDEYNPGTKYVSGGMHSCFYDNFRKLYVVYSYISTNRELRLKYYDEQGTYCGALRLNHPYIEGTVATPNIYFSDGYYYLSICPNSLKEDVAVVGFDNKGNVIREIPNDLTRSCFPHSIAKPANYYRDHLLLWGFNDTIYEVHGKECLPKYRWEIPYHMRHVINDMDRQKEYVDLVQEWEFSPHSIIDTREWLIISTYTLSYGYLCYFYNKSEGVLYGDATPENDLGGYDFSEIGFFDGYYYDETKDEEWLYQTFMYGEMLLSGLEEEDASHTLALRRMLSEKESINPILVMVRLKK